MSDNKDDSQKVVFVYSNLYQIYQKGKAKQPVEAISSLKENLKSLNDLHQRLKFMLTELEELMDN